ncbi:hypothetical protein B5807_03784 [Epicoccum nigrum]|uniref:Integral membrane protein TmpA n=1 Tax=Epicoccum nigrum TaxID=105696 RepID=A0A1Y2M6N8_EPING|nr:hypothetical protein B5807_03784 [Epicoccum nigrum]
MSDGQSRCQVTAPASTLCQQRGRSSVAIPSDQQPPAVYKSNDDRLVEPPQRIIDLEKAVAIQHIRSRSSSKSTRTPTSLVSHTASSSGKESARSHPSSPLGRCSRAVRYVRYGVFAVYQRLFTSVCVVNLAVVLAIAHRQSWDGARVFSLDNLATLASSNFLLAILFRQDWLINILFRTAWLVPWSVPLRLRRIVSRVYCFGGIHSGAAVMGTGWWIGFTVLLCREGVTKGTYKPILLLLALVISSLLATIVLLSLPQLRTRFHNTWELTHRFLGWTAILLFWAQILLLTNQKATASAPFAHVLVRTPTFWCLAGMTALLIYPWLHLRRWTFTATPLSSHAVRLTSPHTVYKYSCLVLSSSPLREWHPFATFPTTSSAGDQAESSMVVSAAGDWTRGLIATASLRAKEQAQNGESNEGVQMQFWVKSHPRAGVMSFSALYARVIIVTTGSGIGPSLGSLLDRPHGQVARLIWSTRSPLKTYGEEMMGLVRRADPEALVLDTDELGRPDLLQVTYRMCMEVGAEAVFVLSNETVTRMMMGGLEKKGVPVYGPIWDS